MKRRFFPCVLGLAPPLIISVLGSCNSSNRHSTPGQINPRYLAVHKPSLSRQGNPGPGGESDPLDWTGLDENSTGNPFVYNCLVRGGKGRVV